MSDGLSLSELEKEREELRKDFIAFSRAYDLIRGRIQESTDMEDPRVPLLHQWSGSRAVCGALEMSIHAIERSVQEMDGLINKIALGEISNLDKQDRPVFLIIDGGKE